MTAHRFFNWVLAVIAALTLAIVWDQPDPDPALTRQQRRAKASQPAQQPADCGNGFWIYLDDQTIECRVRKARGR